MRAKHAINCRRVEACAGEVSQKSGLQVMPILIGHALFLIAYASIYDNKLVLCLDDKGVNAELKLTHFVHEIRL